MPPDQQPPGDPAPKNPDVQAILNDAAALPPIEVGAFLDKACRGDAKLRAEVESLLQALTEAGKFMTAPTEGMARGAAPPGQHAALAEGPGSTIGRYKLLQQVGEGGFGSVFMAEQREPVVRKVALKVIKLGMDTREVIARFEAERQALALMDHPNIAKVLDAGATDSGRPYFVMEFVTGEPITAFCERHNLTIEKRLALFTQVCHAVQHAHHKGVIHRDIKPSNILVSMQDNAPLAKVIDFGIAKATAQRLTEKTLFTQHRQLIGTPEYMSPEQAEGSLDIDTRTDVYSLGVLLYELLTGTTPFEGSKLRSAAWGEIQRIIREEDPPKPSTRISRQSRAEFGAGVRDRTARQGAQVRGDLDWIVMKALEKDRARRYGSPQALAGDIQRHVAGDPVEAAPPSGTYRLSKFVRRHRGAVGAGVVMAALLVVGVVGTTWGMIDAQNARDRAVQSEALAVERFHQAEKAKADAEAARAESELARERAEQSNRIANAVTEFFTHDVLSARPVPEGQPEPTLRDMLDAVPAKIDQHFKSEPAVEGIIRERVGLLYRRLGDVQKSESYLREAIPLLEQGLGMESRATLGAIHRMGEWMMDMARFDEAVPYFDKAYQHRLKTFGMEYRLTVNSLSRRGSALVWAGKHEEGLRDIRAARDYTRDHIGPESRESLLATRDLGEALIRVGQADEAAVLLQGLLATIAANSEQLGQFDGMVRELLGASFLALGKHADALRELDLAVEWANARYPQTHSAFVELRRRRAEALAGLGRADDARAEFESAYDIASTTLGPRSTPATEIASQVAQLLEQAGDTTGAATWREKARK
jgi:tetratricopeptide (TPR) repeat protein